MATEDHDFAEIDHCAIARGAETPLRLRVSADGRVEAREPVAEARLGADVTAAVDAVRDALAARPAGAEVAALLAEHYRPGARFADAFAGLLARSSPTRACSSSIRARPRSPRWPRRCTHTRSRRPARSPSG